MGIKSRILAELLVQEKLTGTIANKAIILHVLETCKTDGEFFTFCKVDFHKYGKLSYESHRFYSIKEHILPLLNVY